MANTTWILYYWPKFGGRGEAIRLLFEDAGIPYVEENEPSKLKVNKPNLRVKRAWVETPGAWISFFVSGPPFTPYQEFLPNFDCLYRIQRPRKPTETRCWDLKRSNNAIMVKIVVSEVDFRALQSNDWTKLATQLILKTPVLGLSSVKISAQSVRYLALHLSTTRTRTTRRRWNKHASPYES